ncbi:low molecular weight protein-tyrosine-phosphatase [Agrobacterium tumefaciens]|uniref:low molecular weight protein-tyrosine-phosphatase n=1 Tax=Agrobacterium tumefaciens TaxID=358 RepID=UPI00157193E3|nr:low molecular weight protein-tyrosine-phosphatase [Agrobacterium tumefaciens]WCJ62199.1 low molecular weight phosphotyrosine protein phosphatase [Agrobacterium tumefaciens]
MKHITVLFVCMGNICRSPLAEGVLKDLADGKGVSDQITVDSAGTGGWHAGDAPDRRSIAMARRHGIDISRQRARQVTRADFEAFDLILAMDENNLANLLQLSPEKHRHKIHLFMDYAAGHPENVPDPYYGAEDGFLEVYNMLLAGCRSLLEKMELDRAS